MGTRIQDKLTCFLKERKSLRYFPNSKLTIGKALGLEKFVADLYLRQPNTKCLKVEQYDVIIVDFSPWGASTTDPLLFDWDELNRETVPGDDNSKKGASSSTPCLFRFVKSARDTRK